MPTFLWTGRDASGQEEAERVTAETPEVARKILEGRGWTELRQETTEIHEFVKSQVEENSDPKFRPNLTPKEEWAFLMGTDAGFWGQWVKFMRECMRECMRESKGTILFLPAWLAWSIFRQRTWGIAISGGLLVVIVCLFPVLHLWFNQSSILFRKLNSAKNWRRWNEVLQCLDKLEKARRATKIGIGEVEVSHYRALAFAGLGRLDEAVAGFTAAANKSDIPQWLFHVRLVALYSVAKQYGKGLEMYRLAVDEATDKSVVWIDMGSYLVERFSCPEEARLLLALAEKSQLSDQARLFLPKLRSLIAYREKDFATMERQSREALSGFEKQPPKIQYAFEPGILICKGYLAVSCAAQGKKDEARRYFAESGDYLAAICLDEFISRYHALMGT